MCFGIRRGSLSGDGDVMRPAPGWGGTRVGWGNVGVFPPHRLTRARARPTKLPPH